MFITDEITKNYNYPENIRHLLYIIIPAFIIKYNLENERIIIDTFKNIPIIMITARSQDEDKIIGEETGADEYITKPFEFSDVLDKINKYLA